jgi:hypothetical protein
MTDYNNNNKKAVNIRAATFLTTRHNRSNIQAASPVAAGSTWPQQYAVTVCQWWTPRRNPKWHHLPPSTTPSLLHPFPLQLEPTYLPSPNQSTVHFIDQPTGSHARHLAHENHLPSGAANCSPTCRLLYLFRKIWPMLNGSARGPHHLARHEHSPAWQETGLG